MLYLYICETNRHESMFDIIRNIIAFVGTFIVISTTLIFLFKLLIFLFTRKYDYDTVDYRIVLLSVGIAIILIPSYCLPC